MRPPKPANPAIPRSAAELSEFLLRACHDLRGPVRAIRAHAELLAKSRGPEDNPQQPLGFILNGVQLASALLDGLTDYSLALQIDSSNFLPLPMDVILRSALAKLAGAIRQHNVDVTYGELPVIRGDADRLMQLMEYLIDYTIRRGGEGHLAVHISAEPHQDSWQFRVANNGADLETELLEKAFAPFERLGGNDRPGPGLATCRVIVERHGGEIRAESQPGAGTTFCFTLPAA